MSDLDGQEWLPTHLFAALQRYEIKKTPQGWAIYLRHYNICVATFDDTSWGDEARRALHECFERARRCSD